MSRPNSVVSGVRLVAEISHDGVFTSETPANTTNQPLAFWEPVVKHIAAPHCVHLPFIVGLPCAGHSSRSFTVFIHSAILIHYLQSARFHHRHHLTFAEYLLCARHSSKYYTCISCLILGITSEEGSTSSLVLRMRKLRSWEAKCSCGDLYLGSGQVSLVLRESTFF